MLADGKTVPRGETIETAVCVVGAGPAGLTLATELGEAGLDVVLVERGDRLPSVPPAVTDTAESVGIPYPVGSSRAFELGGAVHRWAVETPLGDGFGRLRELDPEDFERRPWIAESGWPFGKERLRPFYERARRLFSWLGASDDAHRVWDLDSPSDEAGLMRRVFVFADPSVFPGQIARRLGRSDKVLVLTNSVVTGIGCGESPSHVSAVTVETASDHEFTVEARVYVIAAGGIETPRLLLASRDCHPAGIGNTRDLVGRFFMEHPHYRLGRLFTHDPEGFGQRYEAGPVRLHSGVPVQTYYSLPESLIRAEQVNRAVLRFDPVDMGRSIGAFRSIEAAYDLRQALGGRRRPPSGTLQTVIRVLLGTHHVARHVLDRLRSGRTGRREEGAPSPTFRIRVMAEQVPNPRSRVALGERRDDLGVPIATLDWRLSEHDFFSFRRTQELFGDIVSEGGRQTLDSYQERDGYPRSLIGGSHHMGTTRMSLSPAKGVVDADCGVHGVDNLYVAGSSVFPTVGYANPTLTIVALAMRLADHLKQCLR